MLKANEAPHAKLLGLCQKIWTLAECQGIDVNTLLDKRVGIYPGAFTCLHLAVLAGSVGLVTEFLQWGADPNLPDSYSEKPPIMDAASKGYTEILSHLLLSGANVNQVDFYKEHALIVAARSNQLECLQKLIQNGAEVNLTSVFGANALMYAAQAGSLECVQALVDLGGGDRVDNTGGSVLHYATRAGNTKIFRLLSESLGPSLMDFSIIECTIRSDNEQMLLQLLIEYGLPVTGTKENRKQSALHIAAEHNSLRCMDILLKSRKSLKLDLSMRNSLFAESPLHRACSNANPEAVMLLMKYGADTDEADFNGYTPMFCCINPRPFVLRHYSERVISCICNLIRFGCDLEKTQLLEHQGFVFNVTPLEFAMARRQVLVVKMLISAGACKISTAASSARIKPVFGWKEDENTEQDLEDIKRRLRQPQDLMFLSCITVRKALKRNIEEKILSLPLPAQIQEYLNIPVLDSIVETVVTACDNKLSAVEDAHGYTSSDTSDDEIILTTHCEQ